MLLKNSIFGNLHGIGCQMGSWLLSRVPVKSESGFLCAWVGWVHGSLPVGETLGQRCTG